MSGLPLLLPEVMRQNQIFCSFYSVNIERHILLYGLLSCLIGNLIFIMYIFEGISFHMRCLPDTKNNKFIVSASGHKSHNVSISLHKLKMYEVSLLEMRK